MALVLSHANTLVKTHYCWHPLKIIYNIFEKKEEEEEAEMMQTHNIKLLSLYDLNFWQKNINVFMIKAFI